MDVCDIECVAQDRPVALVQVVSGEPCSGDGFQHTAGLIYVFTTTGYGGAASLWDHMSQITHGIRSVLSHSKIYDLFQWLMGAKRGRTIFATQYIKARKGDFVLDVGCGTAEIRLFLPDVEYYGYDPSARYIEAAKNRLREAHKTGKLLHATLDEAALNELPKFDIVLVSGVLHHLTDVEAMRLAELAKAALKEGGRLVTIDPCLAEGQSLIARYLVSHDRGMHVRNVDGYRSVVSPVFASVVSDVRHDIARFPYTHLIMECKK